MKMMTASKERMREVTVRAELQQCRGNKSNARTTENEQEQESGMGENAGNEYKVVSVCAAVTNSCLECGSFSGSWFNGFQTVPRHVQMSQTHVLQQILECAHGKWLG